ncbi:MAG: hypothetical protein Q4D53_05480 [Leptotrichiaceae bacterium]|nr:hypothetical protein [Leptotrichiaceae bacterium]
MNKELQKFFDENLKEGMGRKQVNDLVDEFVNQYNERIENQEFFLSERKCRNFRRFF